MSYRGFVELPFNPRPLLEICVEACVPSLTRNVDVAELLPPRLKTSILGLATAKGLADERILRALLHRDTPSLSLDGVSVDDQILRVVAGRCRKLASLNLSASGGDKDAMSTAGLLELFPTLGHLNELHLRRCQTVDDRVLVRVAESCPQLKTLDVGGCQKLTDKALFALKDLEHLTSLNISSSQVGNLGILALSEGRSQETLKELVMDKCLAITDFAVNTALKLCSNLTYISFHGCPVSGDTAKTTYDSATYSIDTYCSW